MPTPPAPGPLWLLPGCLLACGAGLPPGCPALGLVRILCVCVGLKSAPPYTTWELSDPEEQTVREDGVSLPRPLWLGGGSSVHRVPPRPGFTHLLLGMRPLDGQPECVLRGRPPAGLQVGGLLGEAGARLGQRGAPVLCSDPWGCPTLRLRGVGSEPGRWQGARTAGAEAQRHGEGGEEGPTESVFLRLRRPLCSLVAGLGEGTGLLRPLTRASASWSRGCLPPRSRLCLPGPSTLRDSGPTKPRPPRPGHTGSQGEAAWGGGSSFLGCMKPPTPQPCHMCAWPPERSDSFRKGWAPGGWRPGGRDPGRAATGS